MQGQSWDKTRCHLWNEIADCREILTKNSPIVCKLQGGLCNMHVAIWIKRQKGENGWK